jgi:hypothetical protein
MTRRTIFGMAGVFTLSIVLMLSAVVPAQRNADSSSNSQAPRTSNGHPDLSGVWQAMNTAAWNIEPHAADVGTPPGMGIVEGEIPYKPSALEARKERFSKRLTDDTDVKCYMPGVPRITYMPYPFEVLQTPTHIMITYEYLHVVRTVYLDGTPHPPGGLIDWWMGDSRAHWEQDTLVVDVIDFNDRTTFDKSGNFHSEKLHVVERYKFIDKDHLSYEATIDDPDVFTRTWKMEMPLYRRIEKNIRPLEYDCYAFKNLWRIPPH